MALIQTVDFFPPMVDDPYSFGKIAAANALSDIYAMGGQPNLAMNLLTFPSCLSLEIVQAILQGGAEKVLEAGAVIAGGHSIEDKEPKYGLCVTGLCRPEEILTNNGVREGDLLLLTKPLGTGILTTAAKVDLLSQTEEQELVEVMAALNKKAAAAAKAYQIHACTDITGFGLLGHAAEMAGTGGLTLEIWAKQVPVLPKALELAQIGVIPAGAYRNRAYVEKNLLMAGEPDQAVMDALFDPQTSGGLLFSVAEAEGPELLRVLEESGVKAAIIGQVKAGCDKKILIR